MVDRLSEYPFVTVRVACTLCDRRGSYRLARLAAKYSAEISLEALIEYLAADCPWRGPHRRRDARCGAHFPDLWREPRPPDEPGPVKLRLVKGGRSA
ncbi:hypothetical protein AncyloWKF20_05570 [Ancylobacter sp. WKF20]|uniref:hypothetical protein n=1 Tax=Ancylobacter sp. WKF20 TaxID=3039801 RepID=UPI002434480F|nr:hypothetical protein [Ancylobacter sp. WKF20]WGD31294.1 hypothetical protein AncyloWKF20_05570 [Ancylobacter sp. WKF20]